MPVVRPRRQPQRTCVSCRETQDKRALIRVVRIPGDGGVTVDERGRASGRGAYLCTNPDCWRRALRAGSLSRALSVQLSPDDRHALEAYLERLEASTPPITERAPREGSPA